MGYCDITENTRTSASGSVPKKVLPRVDGLYVSGLRFYSPKIGRWINRDPLGDLGFHTIMTATIPFELEYTELQARLTRLRPLIIQIIDDLRNIGQRELSEGFASIAHRLLGLQAGTSWFDVVINPDGGLYRFSENDSINMLDVLGLASEECSKWDALKEGLKSVRDNIRESIGEITRLLKKLPEPSRRASAVTTAVGAGVGVAKQIVESPESALGVGAIIARQEALKAMLEDKEKDMLKQMDKAEKLGDACNKCQK